VDQKKPTIIVCGETIILDNTLINALQEFSIVKVLDNYRDLLKLPPQEEKLIVWELSAVCRKSFNIITSIKKRRPEIKIVIINGGTGTKTAAEILKAGAADIFPQPFDLELLIDRVVALLRLNNST